MYSTLVIRVSSTITLSSVQNGHIATYDISIFPAKHLCCHLASMLVMHELGNGIPSLSHGPCANCYPLRGMAAHCAGAEVVKKVEGTKPWTINVNSKLVHRQHGSHMAAKTLWCELKS